jgi:hypothetical protein
VAASKHSKTPSRRVGTADSEPDAKLLELGTYLDTLIDKYLEAVAEENQLEHDNPALRVEAFPAERLEQVKFWLARRDSGLDRVIKRQSAIFLTIDRFAKLIRPIEARTLEGMRVKAKLEQFCAPELWWDELENLDDDEQRTRRFVDEVMSAPQGGTA